MAGDTGIELTRSYADEATLEGQGGLPFQTGKVVQRQTGEIYRFVQIRSSDTTYPRTGDVVKFTNTADGKAGKEVTITDTATDQIGAGVVMSSDGGFTDAQFVANANINLLRRNPDGNGNDYGRYIWIMVKGRTTLRQDLENSPQDGNALTMGSGDGKLALWDNSGTNDSPIVGHAIDASEKLVSVNFGV